MSKKIEKRIERIKRPCKIGGSYIPIGYSKKDMFKRIKMYIKDALIFSTVYTLFLYLLIGNKIFVFKFESELAGIVVHILMLLVFFVITNAVWWEYKVRTYHKKVADIRRTA
ncbi:hypothetical protein QE109_01440 [Fusibacter bizertensis]|uniref:Uncharacterized protein n=1 Tax=Fusibacter bizertensis TaxID=1488331 RepID=A0ABT6N8P9_9FIRM|nr:hypothetical protein [Fusibacter bizertensis]MDH8676786.1 hypothetical protein [Fusibacter bizertensis]